jgi:hypothetical protein
MLIQICYASVASAPLDDAALEALLTKARANNGRDGITGLLLYGNGHFVQVIEGEEAPVAALYAKIVTDRRHMQVFEVYRDVVSTRDFARWMMAFERLTEFKPEFLRASSHARALVNLFLEKEMTLTRGAPTPISA